MVKRLVFLLTILCAGCSGSPIKPSAFNTTFTGTVTPFGTSRETLQVPRAGAMTVSLTWSDPSVDLDLYLAPTSCTTLYPIASCGILAAATSTSTTETLNRNVASNENFAIFVDNLNISKPAAYTIAVSIP